MGLQAEKNKRKTKRTRQKNTRCDSKVESNGSPEIPDWGKKSDIPGPFGGFLAVAEEENICLESTATPYD